MPQHDRSYVPDRDPASDQPDHWCPCAQAALELLTAAAECDRRARDRDIAARARDVAAEARDLAITRADKEYERDTNRRAVTGAEIVIRAADQRRRAEQYRAQTAQHRAHSARDRLAAAADREQAARDRLQATADRELLARELSLHESDPPSDLHTRASRLRELDRELDRCRRSGSTLSVACVTVVGSHARQVERLLEGRLRSYDLVVPHHEDETVCALSGAALADARRRIGELTEELASSSQAATIVAGFAELGAEDSSAELIARAERDVFANAPR
jgi:hypothetical protein